MTFSNRTIANSLKTDFPRLVRGIHVTLPIMEKKAYTLELADSCVKCGLCASHCPTYLKTQSETQSPRGRIALVQGFLKEELKAADIQPHLDSCLGCRSCEKVCPSEVRYGELLDYARAALPKPKRRVLDWLLAVLTRLPQQPRKLAFLYRLLRLMDFLGLRRLAQSVIPSRRIPLQALTAYWPKLPAFKPLKTYYPALQERRRGRIAFFTGCLPPLLDRASLHDAIYVLQKLGYDLMVPTEQSCCGALALHSGDLTQAHQLQKHNQRIFQFNPSVDYLVTGITGCHNTLHDYGQHSLYETEIETLATKLIDIYQLIMTELRQQQLKLQPYPHHVLCHSPCSYSNLIGDSNLIPELLALIPECRVSRLKTPTKCCGAAGQYMLQQPEMATTLCQDIMTSLSTEQPEILTSPNLGCALHIGAHFPTQKGYPKIIHPLSILARSV